MERFEIAQLTRPSVCDKHGEYEEKGMTLPFGERRTIWTGCPACAQERADAASAEQAAAWERERQARLEQRLDQAGIPARFRDRTFENFVADTEPKRAALGVAREFADTFPEHLKNGTTIVFSGKPGTGKSHLAIAAAMVVMQRHTAMYINALDMVRMVRATWRRDSDVSESSVLSDLSSVGLLVIDEVGMQYGTEGEQVILFDVINRRYRDLMPTILLTNLGAKGMKEFLGERAFDRLREGGTWVAFDWESYRGIKKAAQELGR
ncbi:ATP-binding protein [Burkholderia gladioli]|uniref:ATP-binding protein n=1 Tax=Burkholderia gladioli TaxID=28095 RepID=UPI00163FC1BD|nr:ATP-binding protein [Burkholderia gladioli]